jgi:hypothetical protein
MLAVGLVTVIGFGRDDRSAPRDSRKVGSCEGFRMPAPHRGSQALRWPTYETLQGTKPREVERALAGKHGRGVDLLSMPHRTRQTAGVTACGRICMSRISGVAPLAALTRHRNPRLPDVPTLHETIMPNYDLLASVGRGSQPPASLVAALVQLAAMTPPRRQRG